MTAPTAPAPTTTNRAAHLASLDPEESAWQNADSSTTPPPTSADLCETWRHSCWHRDRMRVWDSLVKVGASESRLSRFAACGSNAWVMGDPDNPDRVRVAACYCHDRWCVPCGRAKARTVAGNLRCLIADEPHRFITLTLRADDEGLAQRITRLYQSFARLRRTTLWQRAVTGGCACCEPVWSDKSGCWHVHLHVIVAGRYIKHADLSKAWLRATGDSYIVDIRLIHGHDKAVDYVTKYACKPLPASTVRDSDHLAEAMIALRGRRLVLTFGAWSHVKLTAQSDTTQWIAIAPLPDVLRRADLGDAWSIAILRKLRGSYACRQMDLWTEQPYQGPPVPGI